MTMFDAQVRAAQITVQPVPSAPDKQPEQAELILLLATLLPTGPQQAAQVPVGAVRAPMDKQAVGDLIKELQEVHESLAEPSRIQTASSLSEADRIAQIQQGLT